MNPRDSSGAGASFFGSTRWGEIEDRSIGHAHYDVASDGSRFVMIQEDREALELMRLVVAWDDELRRLVPSAVGE